MKQQHTEHLVEKCKDVLSMGITFSLEEDLTEEKIMRLIQIVAENWCKFVDRCIISESKVSKLSESEVIQIVEYFISKYCKLDLRINFAIQNIDHKISEVTFSKYLPIDKIQVSVGLWWYFCLKRANFSSLFIYETYWQKYFFQYK